MRARVKPGPDYQDLARIIQVFGKERCFVIASNCDGLHGYQVEQDHIKEIHGSLAKLQCSAACSDELWDADEKFVERLETDKN